MYSILIRTRFRFVDYGGINYSSLGKEDNEYLWETLDLSLPSKTFIKLKTDTFAFFGAVLYLSDFKQLDKDELFVKMRDHHLIVGVVSDNPDKYPIVTLDYLKKSYYDYIKPRWNDPSIDRDCTEPSPCIPNIKIIPELWDGFDWNTKKNCTFETGTWMPVEWYVGQGMTSTELFVLCNHNNYSDISSVSERKCRGIDTSDTITNQKKPSILQTIIAWINKILGK